MIHRIVHFCNTPRAFPCLYRTLFRHSGLPQNVENSTKRLFCVILIQKTREKKILFYLAR